MFSSATYDREKKTVTYVDKDGNETLYIGGSFAWRTNNPGNLTKPGTYVMDGAIGYAQRTGDTKSLFVIFPDRTTGNAAHKKVLKSIYGDSTIKGMITKYAPPVENDTDKYIDFVTKKAGVSASDVVGSLSDGQFDAVAAAMEQQEGYVPGLIQFLGKPVQVQLLDKMHQPFSGQKISIKSADRHFETRSDQGGLLPWIYSGLFDKEVNIYYNREEGDPEHVGAFSTGLSASAYTFAAPYYLLNSQPRIHETETSVRPAVHIVRSGETLSSIATRYGTAVDAIVRENGLTDPNHIYARQHLRIPGVQVSAAKPATSAHASPHLSESRKETRTQVTNQRNQNGHPETVLSSVALELSGKAWCSRFPGSKSIDSLEPPFKSKVIAFFGALRTAGIGEPTVSATLRPPKRSYLMHSAFHIAKGLVSPDKVERYDGVNIDWIHRSVDGTMDLAASKNAAIEMCNGYRLKLNDPKQRVGKAGSSRHNFGAAIDMNITHYVGKKVKDADGDEIELKSFSDLVQVGNSYGVRFYAGENMHWSDTGN
jgi:LysM repeat protein